jgi:hypothetical protein
VSAPQFIEFGDRIVNVSRIVSMAPPIRTAAGFELEARVDGFSFKEIFDDIDEANARYADVATFLLAGHQPVRTIEAADDPDRLRALLSELATEPV